MNKKSKLHPRFVIDENGDRTAVILPIEEYNELLEDLADLAAIAERRDEATLPHDKVREELKKYGLLSDSS